MHPLPNLIAPQEIQIQWAGKLITGRKERTESVPHPFSRARRTQPHCVMQGQLHEGSGRGPRTADSHGGSGKAPLNCQLPQRLQQGPLELPTPTEAPAGSLELPTPLRQPSFP